MKRQQPVVVWLLIVVLSAVLMLQLGGAGVAQVTDEESPSANVQVVGLANGQVGFFDPSAKRLYVYGPDLRMAVTVVEINQLGQPLQMVQRTGR